MADDKNNTSNCDDDDAEENADDDKELFLSNHTQSMRRALKICQRNYNASSCCMIHDGFKLVQATTRASMEKEDVLNENDNDINNIVHDQRQAALQQLWEKLQCSSRNDKTNSSSIKNEEDDEKQLSSQYSSSSSNIIAELDVSSYNDYTNIDYFVHNFHRSNQPCLIRGLHQTNFGNVMEQWGTRQKARAWFMTTLGPDRLLPIRQRLQQHQCHQQQQEQTTAPNSNTSSSSSSSSSSHDNNITSLQLDPDGRAMECETLEMSLQEWIDYLNNPRNNSCSRHKDNDHHNKETHDAADLYLKDWHLEQWLEKISGGSNNDQEEKEKKRLNGSNITTLADLGYTLPDIFQHDLLNPFLHMTRTGGDYRFVYWGPAHSGTDWHSDVLHSFSWSFNVYGTKEWTFCLPQQQQDKLLLETSDSISNGNNDKTTTSTTSIDGDRYIVLRQSAGECVFVPAMWKHQVVNLEETLSINRNWITTANLDLTWECLYTEIVAIHREFASWSTGTCSSNNTNMTTKSCGKAATTTSGNNGCVEFDWEAHESMLRGCVGLDVTAFFFMMLYRLLELLAVLSKQQQLQQQQQQHTTSDRKNHGVVFWEKLKFDLVRLQRALCVLFQDEVIVCLPKRLAATLASPAMGREAVDMALGAIDVVKVYVSHNGARRTNGNKTKNSKD